MQKSIIYQITDKDTGKCYIGSTFQTLEKRMREHKNSHNECASALIIKHNNYEAKVILTCYVSKHNLKKLELNFITNSAKCVNIKGTCGIKKIINKLNYDIFFAKKQGKIKCECGLYYTNSKTHFKNKTHILYMVHKMSQFFEFKNVNAFDIFDTLTDTLYLKNK